MAIDIHNFVARSFRGPDLARVDHERYSNALMRNRVERLPQQNQAEDLAIKQGEQSLRAGEMELSVAQQRNAAGILGRQIAMIASSPRAKETAIQITSSPDFQAAAAALKLPPMQITSEDTDDLIRTQAAEIARMLGADVTGIGGMPAGVVEFEHMTRGLAEDDKQRAARIRLGLDSRSGQGRVTDVNGVPTWTGIGDDGQPYQIPLSTLQQTAGAAGTIKQEEALGAGRGQAQAEREAGAPVRAERARQQITNIDNLLTAVDSAESKIDWNTTGFVGNATKNIAGTPAHDLQQQLLTIQANLGFDRIQQMREASPTGGALGQVAVQELNALQASVAALAQSQSDAQLRDNLKKVKTHYQNWRNVIVRSGQQSQGGMPDFSTMTDQQLLDIINGQ